MKNISRTQITIFLDTLTQADPTARTAGKRFGERFTNGKNPLMKRAHLKMSHYSSRGQKELFCSAKL